MRNLSAEMLRSLLEQIESGEVVITYCNVTPEVEEAQDGTVRPTGEQDWYITTKPGAVPTKTLDAFGQAVATFNVWVEEFAAVQTQAPALVKRTPTLEELTQAVDTLLSDYEGDRIQRFELYRVAPRIGLEIVKAANQYPLGTQGYSRLIQLAARLGRALSHV